MKFIHTADWHLGKVIHEVSLLDMQREVLEQFVKLVAKEKPDAVIIAGDIYDRSIPSAEAINLLNEILFKINIELKTPVIAIAGNHDSAERLSFGSSWYEQSQFYLKGKLDSNIEPVNINGVNFYLIPYAEPGVVRQVFQNKSVKCHESAMKVIVDKICEIINYNEPNVFVGHAFILGGKETDSERTLFLGGTGAISPQIFAPFSYAALGHLHSPHALQDKKIRYSGSLLKYSFSEVNQQKSVSIVEMAADGTFNIRYHKLTPSKDMRAIEGTLAQLLNPDFYKNEQTEDYLKVTLLDEGALLDPMSKLRQVYPNVLQLVRKQASLDIENREKIKLLKDKQQDELQLFEQFYTNMTTSTFDESKRKIMIDVINDVRKEEGLK